VISSSPREALVVCYSELTRDPRVLRQISWLVSDGWTVDTIGFGTKPNEVRNHFQISLREHSKFVRALALFFIPKKALFRFLSQRRVPVGVQDELETYDAFVINEIDLLPWVLQLETLQDRESKKIILDLHEYHQYEAPPGLPSVVSSRLQKYYDWKRSLIGKIDFDAISAVALGIAERYEKEFDLETLHLVSNSKPYVEISPSEVDANQIELLYHGLAQVSRGLDVLLDAASLLNERFSLNMLLTGPTKNIEDVRLLAVKKNVRVNWFEPVEMSQVSSFINRFDVSVNFFPPQTVNSLYAFPNKFFEAIQGRLAIVIGESPSMRDVIEEFENGFVVSGWSARDLAHAINALDVEDIRKAKQNSGLAAKHLNDSEDRRRFLAMLR
jgi:glycosyltransferase involved in cell wall biosynthesis